MVLFLLYVTFLSIFFLDWLYYVYQWFPRPVIWIPEVVSVLLLGRVVLHIGIERYAHFNPKYFLLLTIYMIHIIFGVIYNDLPSGVTFAGLRIYFKFIPFFLLPAIYHFTQEQITQLLRFLMWLTVIQFPVALYQRLTAYGTGNLSGDVVGGTLGYNRSGVLTVYLCVAASMVIAHYLRDRLSFRQFALLLFIVLAPTSINETKIVFFLVPIIFFLPFIVSTQDREAVGKLMPLLAIMGVGLLGIQLVYDYFVQERWGYGIFSFFTMEGRLSGYVAQTRLHSLEMAWHQLTQDPMQLILGVGAGNAHSSNNPSMSGHFASDQLDELHPIRTGLSGFLWELGLGGVFLMLWLVWMLFWDAVRFAAAKGFMGTFSLGAINITAIFGIAFFYFFALDANVMIYTFFLVAGFLAAGDYYAKVWNHE